MNGSTPSTEKKFALTRGAAIRSASPIPVRRAPPPVYAKCVEDVILLIVLVIGIGHFTLREFLSRRVLPQVVQTVWFFVRKSAEQRRIDDGEDHCARTHAECECRHSNDGESGSLQESSNAVTQVLY